MCIPHSTNSIKSHKSRSAINKSKPKKIDKPSEDMMKKGDPDFIDERTSEYIPKKKWSIWNIFGLD